MEEEKKTPKTTVQIRDEYAALCAYLGEKVYQAKLIQQEIDSWIQKISDKHAEAKAVEEAEMKQKQDAQAQKESA